MTNGQGQDIFSLGGVSTLPFSLWRLSLDWYFLGDGVPAEAICMSLSENRLTFFTNPIQKENLVWRNSCYRLLIIKGQPSDLKTRVLKINALIRCHYETYSFENGLKFCKLSKSWTLCLLLMLLLKACVTLSLTFL